MTPSSIILDADIARTIHCHKHIGRITLITVCILLVIATALYQTAPLPPGPWSGMYRSFWPVWLTVLLAVILLLSACYLGYASRQVAYVLASLVSLLIIGLSLQWTVPYGVRDPWRHIYFINAGIFSLETNPYPLFHTLGKSLAIVLDISTETVVTKMPALNSIVGVSGLALVVSQLDVSPRTQMIGVVATIPVSFIGFIARPFTLGMLFPLFLYWVVGKGNWKRRNRILSGLLAGVVLWFHPVAMFAVGCIIGVTVPISLLSRSQKVRSHFDIRPHPPLDSSIFALFVSILLSVHIFLVSPVGKGILGRALAGSGLGRNKAGDGGGILADILPALWEFLRRTSLLWLLGLGATVAIFREIRNRNLHLLTITSYGAAALLGAFFVLLNFIPGTNVGWVTRIISIGPILLVPAFVRSLDATSAWHVLAAISVITVGGAVAYDSPINGGFEQGTSVSQVAQVNWIGEFTNDPEVVADGSVFWISVVEIGPQTNRKWVEGSSGQTRYKRRHVEFPWQVTDRSDNALYPINSRSRFKARQQAEVGNPTALVNLRRFKSMSSRVYDNGAARLYQQS